MYIDAWKNFKPDRDHQHEVYEGKGLLIPDLEILGWLRFRRALPNALHLDKHRETIEVFYIAEGQVDWIIEGKKQSLKGGEIMVIMPGCLHGAETSALQPCEHYWLRFKYPKSGQFAGVTAKETKELLASIQKIAQRPWKAGSEVKNLFRDLMDCHRHPKKYGALRGQTLFQQLLIQLAEDENYLDEIPVRLSPYFQAKIKKAIAAIQMDGSGEMPTVGQMEAAAGLKSNTFRQMFEQYTGMTPNHFLINEQIARAKQNLLMGKSITGVAHAAGFSSGQYFATVFKQWTGQTPSAYLKTVKK